ncbi:MAG: LysR family transcriptional regulator [Oscillospiraceae bacterium]|nr:LysR family transcriptional regulator [Oscillospiraceae bacterium]
MYDEYLKTFICVAECGSFTKAAELLYLSPNAVKKRIGSLEESTGISLFERTLKGEKLTSAGKSFYSDAKNMVQSYNNAVERAKRIQESGEDFIKIGIMDTFADEFMTAKWFQPSDKVKRAKASMVFFGSSSDNLGKMLNSIGTDIDLAVDICEEKLAKKFGVTAVKISEAKICCAVPYNHRLSKKEEITPADLCGEKVAILKSGRNELWDNIIRDIRKDFFGIEIFEIDKYSIKTFNRCENENRIVFMTEHGGKSYPFCKCVPLSKTYLVPFGIYISDESNEKTLSFIEEIKKSAPKD